MLAVGEFDAVAIGDGVIGGVDVDFTDVERLGVGVDTALVVVVLVEDPASVMLK